MSVSSILASDIKTIEYGPKTKWSNGSRHSTKNLPDFINLALNASSFPDIHHLCMLVSCQYGFNYFGFGALTPTLSEGPILSHVYAHGSQWTDHYKKNRYMAVDPFAMHCVSNVTPLLWRNTDPLGQFDADAKKMVTDAMDFGMCNIVQIPMHSATGGIGGIRFSNFDDKSMNESDIRTMLPELFYWSAFLHGAIERVVQQKSPLNTSTKLSTREQEVLKWAACGKEACVISDILKISETTVLTHFKNAYLKLGVRTRPHAVAKALSLRLIYI